MPVYGYVRVSTARQAQDGESLDVQQRTIAGYALMLGLTIHTTFIERGVSGSIVLNQRPEGGRLMAVVGQGDIIITPKLDRMFRSSLDALGVLTAWKDAGIALHMIDLGGDVTGNGVSKLVFTILSAVAEAERDRIRERVSTVKADQKARGKYLGGRVPYGFTYADGDLIPEPTEQQIIARMRALRSHGVSLRGIRTTLDLSLSLDAISRVVNQA